MYTKNFRFLEQNQPEMAALCGSAEGYVHTDPQSAVVKLRCFAEVYVGFIYEELSLPTYGGKTFFELLDNSEFKNVIERCVVDKLHLIRMKGNKAAHPMGVNAEEALGLLKEAYFLSAWIYLAYHGGHVEELPQYAEPQLKPAESDLLKSDLLQANEQLAQQAEDLVQARSELDEAQKRQTEALQRLAASDVEVNQPRLVQLQEAGQRAVAGYDFEVEQTRDAISMADVFAEYELTDGQADLVKQLDGFLSGRDASVFLLKGYAGTGKTFITKGVTEYFRAIGRNYVLAAPTGKASKVIATKTKSPAYTIHKTIYSFKDIKEYTEDKLDGSETYKYYAELAVNDLPVDTVYIVDESSMIADVYSESEFFRCGSGYLLRDFLKFVNLDHNDHRKKVIFIGDDAQLSPVGMKTSPALNSAYLVEGYGLISTGYELTEVVRQKADSGVMQNATTLRQALKENVFNKLDFDLAYIDIAHVDHADLIGRYLESCNHKINAESIVIAHSNVDVAAYNRRIREEFFPGELKICTDDKVMATTNSDLYGFFISNGDFGQVRKVLADTESRTRTIKHKLVETGEVEEIIVPLAFRRVEVGFRDLEGKVHFFVANIIENLLYSDAKTLSSDENKALYLDFCFRHPGLKRGSLEFKEALRSDPYFNALRLKFGYAITCHKAQGSEWNHVFVKCKTQHQSQLCTEYFRWLYTAITRTAKQLYLLEEPHIKLGSGIKVVNNPGMSGADVAGKPPAQFDIGNSELSAPAINYDAVAPIHRMPSVNDDEDFGIPSANRFLLVLLKEVQACLASTDVTIYDIHHHQYQEAYFFSRGSESVRVNITYNGRQKIASVAFPQPSGFGSELLEHLSPLKGRVLTSAASNGKAHAEFDDSFLNELHQRLLACASAADISITHVEEQQYSQRYWFRQSNETAVMDIYYNKKKQFTSCDPKKNLSNSGALLSQVVTLITEGLT
jgi:hypothetical protein